MKKALALLLILAGCNVHTGITGADVAEANSRKNGGEVAEGEDGFLSSDDRKAFIEQFTSDYIPVIGAYYALNNSNHMYVSENSAFETRNMGTAEEPNLTFRLENPDASVDVQIRRAYNMPGAAVVITSKDTADFVIVFEAKSGQKITKEIEIEFKVDEDGVEALYLDKVKVGIKKPAILDPVIPDQYYPEWLTTLGADADPFTVIKEKVPYKPFFNSGAYGSSVYPNGDNRAGLDAYKVYTSKTGGRQYVLGSKTIDGKTMNSALHYQEKNSQGYGVYKAQHKEQSMYVVVEWDKSNVRYFIRDVYIVRELRDNYYPEYLTTLGADNDPFITGYEKVHYQKFFNNGFYGASVYPNGNNKAGMDENNIYTSKTGGRQYALGSVTRTGKTMNKAMKFDKKDAQGRGVYKVQHSQQNMYVVVEWDKPNFRYLIKDVYIVNEVRDYPDYLSIYGSQADGFSTKFYNPIITNRGLTLGHIDIWFGQGPTRPGMAYVLKGIQTGKPGVDVYSHFFDLSSAKPYYPIFDGKGDRQSLANYTSNGKQVEGALRFLRMDGDIAVYDMVTVGYLPRFTYSLRLRWDPARYGYNIDYIEPRKNF